MIKFFRELNHFLERPDHPSEVEFNRKVRNLGRQVAERIPFGR